MNAIGAAALLLLGALALSGIVVVIAEVPSDRPPPPRMELRSNETADMVRVVSSEPELSWEEFDVKLRYTGAFTLSGSDEIVHGEHLVFTEIDLDDPVEPGDHFHVCRYGEGLPQVVTLRHEATLQLVGIWHFSEVSTCDEMGHDHED